MSHIKTIRDDTMAWCGDMLATEFYFKDAEHAALNGLHDAKQMVCVRCVDAVVHALNEGRRRYE